MVRPDRINYQNLQNADSVSFSYHYDILRQANNKRYYKKEIKRNIRLVAIRIINESDSITDLNRYEFYAGKNKAALLPVTSVYKKLKQKWWPFLFYSLLTINSMETHCIGGRCRTRSKIVFPIGVFIAAGNIIYASISNQHFKKELSYFEYKPKSLQPGEHYYALIGIQEDNYEPITLHLTIP